MSKTLLLPSRVRHSIESQEATLKSGGKLQDIREVLSMDSCGLGWESGNASWRGDA